MLKKVQKIFFSLLVLYGILGFFILPLILKSQLPKLVQENTNAKINIEHIYFNPFVFTLKLSDIDLKTTDEKPLLSLKSASLDFELYSLFNSTIHLKSFILQKPKIFLVYNKDKTFNLLKIIKPSPKKTEKKEKTSTKLPKILLDLIAIKKGCVEYKDYSHKSKFEFSFNHIGFELKNINTSEFKKHDGTLRFYTKLGDGGFVDIKTDIINIEPLKLKGSLDFKASKLYTEWRYLKDSLNLEVADGKVALYGEYSLNLDDLNATTIDNTQISLENLRVKPVNKHKDVLNLSALNINDITIKPMLQDVEVKSITLNSLYIKAKRDAKKNIDWLAYIKTNNITTDKNTTTKKTDTSSKAWSVKVKDVALKNIKVDFHDEGIKPAVDTNLNKLNFYAQNITLSGEKPLNYQFDMIVNDNFNCSSSGDLIHKQLSLNSYMKCNGFDITHYNPYINYFAKKALKVYDLNLKSAIFDFDINATLFNENNQSVINVLKADTTLRNFRLDKKSTHEKLTTFKSLKLNDITLNTKTKKVTISDTVLSALDIKARRLSDGKLNFKDLVIPHATKKRTKSKQITKKTKDYEILLKHVGIKSSQLHFKDEVLKPSVKSKIDKITLDAYNISSNKKSWLKYALYMRVNGAGEIKADGRLRHTPLKQQGSFKINKISLKDLTPYLQPTTYLSIDDGFLSIGGKTVYEKQKNKPDLSMQGDLKLESFFVSDVRDNSLLLSCNDINIDPFTYEMFPNRLFMDEVSAESFYVNAFISKDKKLNFASLLKPSKETNTTTKTDDTKDEKFPLKIMKLNIKKGSAKFADLSLPIKFSTNIHDLNGVIYAISNQKDETSYVDISGEVDEYGSTKLKGSINSGNPKSYTDLNFNFRNLELSSISGYSASFAGYKIDSGKLYLDLGYNILDSQLVGKNSIIIKKIKLGDEFKDENTTSMPLGFVIALLEDSDGIIDIDMPVEGNVDNPDFKYGKLIWKTFANLIVKAVTSPFKFLGSMMGIDGDKLESIDFEHGLANILPPEKEKLDSIAKIMIKRPKISLSISATYDEVYDKKELQKAKLIALVLKKSGAKNKDEHQSMMTVDVLEAIYKEMRDLKQLDKIKKRVKQNYKKDGFERAYLNALVKECINIQPLKTAELEALATKRANVLKAYLVEQKALNSSRIILTPIKPSDKDDEKYTKTKMEIIVN